MHYIQSISTRIQVIIFQLKLQTDAEYWVSKLVKCGSFTAKIGETVVTKQWKLKIVTQKG